MHKNELSALADSSHHFERVFANAKKKHGMRYTQYRGLERVSNWVKLKYVAMNLKKLAMWKYKSTLSFYDILDFIGAFIKSEMFA